ncbi:MAG: sodium:solute symporter family protein [Synergistaceae bacterium]|nr:sodium:solute symporter family protein [Synergistaceae bacterium]
MVETGIILVVVIVSCAGLLAGRRVSSSSDFLTGSGKASSFITTGALVGTLLGSQCTIGTAQLAFSFGLSALWFTLGTGVSCLVLALTMSDKLRASGCTTQFQIIAREYGQAAEKTGGILSTAGIFISILAQVTACIGFITALYPSVSPLWACAFTVIFMCMYIVMGGTWGAGMAGIVKVLLLYSSCVVCVIAVLMNYGGLSGLVDAVRDTVCSGRTGQVRTGSEFSARYLSMTARGALKDYGSCVSLVLGVLSTQTYMQFILSAKGEREARKSLYWAAVLVPPAGAAGVMIGLFIRANYITQAEVNSLISAGLDVPSLPVIASTIQTFPMFVINHVPAVLRGVILGALLITIISGSSGLLLGISAILTEDIFSASDFVKRHTLLFSRAIIIITLIIAVSVSEIMPVQAINDLGFLSMTLRACVVFMPLVCALWLKGRVKSGAVLASMIISPLAAVLSAVMKLPVEPLFVGMGVSILLTLGC